MSSSSLIHASSPAEASSCDYQIERFSAPRGEERRRRINSDLPEEVLTEILLRLPVKTLILCKCVCKFWYDLIGSPSFISTHYTINQSKNKVSFYCQSYFRRNWTMSFRFSDTPLDLNGLIGFEQPEIVGCSYGLVCISLFSRWHSRFIIWNPATRASRHVFVACLDATWIYSGFWFDPIANTHKLVRVTIYPYREESWQKLPRGRTRVCLHIFTLKAHSCRIKELVLPYEIPEKGTKISWVTYVERCMYWVLDVLSEKYLLCFDMANELFQRIEFPCLDRGDCSTMLDEYKGSLAMFVWEATNSVSAIQSFDIWLLNDFGGGKQSWSKQLTLRPPFVDVLVPIGFFTKDGVDLVALCTDTGYFLWNTVSGETSSLFCRRGCIRQFFIYCESFASVD